MGFYQFKPYFIDYIYIYIKLYLYKSYIFITLITLLDIIINYVNF